jgi:DNA processing protein
MGLKTEYIVKILQLKGVGRKAAFKICDLVKNEIIDNDFDLQEIIIGFIVNKKISRLQEYTKAELSIAFEQGEQILEKSERAGIKILSAFNSDFPEYLKDIHDKPIILNFKGNYKNLNNHDGIAIIGTREPTKEGEISGEFFGEYFGKKGYNVVSGLAKGCDTAAHLGCLKGRGMTTAIVAHGLQMVYPKENEELAERIINSGGVLLSEYFIGEGALGNNFVERDRLQAGLSKATIVIQTDIEGGTMYAVNTTLNSNKPLAAVRYKPDIYSSEIRGNDMLIKTGKAFALTSNSVDEFFKMISDKP